MVCWTWLPIYYWISYFSHRVFSRNWTKPDNALQNETDKKLTFCPQMGVCADASSNSRLPTRLCIYPTKTISSPTDAGQRK